LIIYSLSIDGYHSNVDCVRQRERDVPCRDKEVVLCARKSHIGIALLEMHLTDRDAMVADLQFDVELVGALGHVLQISDVSWAGDGLPLDVPPAVPRRDIPQI